MKTVQKIEKPAEHFFRNNIEEMSEESIKMWVISKRKPRVFFLVTIT
jgi:hypothetical protein